MGITAPLGGTSPQGVGAFGSPGIMAGSAPG